MACTVSNICRIKMNNNNNNKAKGTRGKWNGNILKF